MTRIYTGILLIAATIGIVFFAPPAAFFLLVAAVAFAAGREFFTLSSAIGVDAYPRAALVLGFLLLLTFYFDPAWLYLWPAAGVIGIFAFWLLADGDTRTAVDQTAFTLLGVAYTAGLAGYFLPIRKMDDGRGLLLFLFLIVWLGDTAAYYGGRRFGKILLAPNISPGKTREGAVAGLAGSLLAAPIAKLTVLPGVAWGHCLLVAAVCGIIGQLGDLAESGLKRAARVKDSGTLFPGHGGVLDRIDSLLFAGPAFYLYFRWALS